MCGKLCGKLNVGKKSVENVQHKKYVFPINNLHITFIVTVNLWGSSVVLEWKKYIGKKSKTKKCNVVCCISEK